MLCSGINFLNFILRVMLTVNLTVQRRKLVTHTEIYWLVLYYNVYYKYIVWSYMLIQLWIYLLASWHTHKWVQEKETSSIDQILPWS